jgi:EF hand domain-containing protein
MNKIALIIAAAGVAGFSGAAFAQGTSPTFEQADTNHNGFVDFTEAQVAFPGLTDGQFKNADINHDEKLTADEYIGLSPVSPTQNENNKTSSNAAPAPTSSQASNPS